MHQVYIGARPGRPTLLLVACALSLLGAVGLSWLQVRETRRLGPEVNIPGTPLYVRPPAGWRVDPQDPRAFIRTVRIEGRRRDQLVRRIRFDYQQWNAYEPITMLLRHRNLFDLVSNQFGGRGAMIGPFSAVQVVRLREIDFFGRREPAQTAYRLAMSPRGEEINVEYYPLGELTPGDLDLLDEICASVRIDGLEMPRYAEEIIKAAGLRFRPSPGWRVFPGHVSEAPALHIEGRVADRPAWAITVARTWLTTGRDPAELIDSLSNFVWARQGEGEPHTEEVRGGRLYSRTRPSGIPDDFSVLSVHLLARDAAHAAIMLVQVDARAPGASEAAREAGRALLESIEFEQSPFPEGLLAAERAGVALAADLSSGIPPEWAGRSHEAGYYSESPAAPDFRQRPLIVEEVRRAPSDGRELSGRRRYRRFEQALRDAQIEDWVWRADGAFRFARELFDPLQPGVLLQGLRFERAPGAARIEIVLDYAGRRTLFESAPPERYIAPPLETLAELRVARGAAPAAIIVTHASEKFTPRLVMRLPPDEQGNPRVLGMNDFFPHAQVLTFDAAGEILTQIEAGRRLDRTTPAEVRERFDAWHEAQSRR